MAHASERISWRRKMTPLALAAALATGAGWSVHHYSIPRARERITPEYVLRARQELREGINLSTYRHAKSNSDKMDALVDSLIEKRAQIREDFEKNKSALRNVGGKRITVNDENILFENAARDARKFQADIDQIRKQNPSQTAGDEAAFQHGMRVLEHATLSSKNGLTQFHERLSTIEEMLKKSNLSQEHRETLNNIVNEFEEMAAYFGARAQRMEEILQKPSRTTTSREPIAQKIEQEARQMALRRGIYSGVPIFLVIWLLANYYGKVQLLFKKLKLKKRSQ